ncbi:MAG: nucleoside kinase [Oscillospiraceae bacterium]|nr:nucleoside kinase [Oscillospiraceae bacterium]
MTDIIFNHPDASIAVQWDDKARRVYERSARFLFLAAAFAECPGARVSIEHSVHYGIYASLSQPVDSFTVARIERRMRMYVEADAPFVREDWPVSRLRELYDEGERSPAARLLASNPAATGSGTVPVYSLDGYKDYLFGELLSSAGALRVFALHPYAPGMVLQIPSSNPDTLLNWTAQPKYMRTFEQAARWAHILNVRYAADLNECVRGGAIRDLVLLSEALHEKTIAEIADQIVERGARAILIAGPSSSGKTTFTHRLAIQLRVLGERPLLISLDDFYLPREDIPLDADGARDLEHIDALNISLLNKQLSSLLQDEAVVMPRYDFTKGETRVGPTVQLGPDQPLLIEGIHGLNPLVSASLPKDVCFRIYISALTALSLDAHNRMRTTDARLIRRIVRDHHFRGARIERTLEMWQSVRRGEERWIFPHQETADVSFNSALPYELTALKKYAAPLLAEARVDPAHKSTLERLRLWLDMIESADVERDIGPTSLLREFIGGCSFYSASETE